MFCGDASSPIEALTFKTGDGSEECREPWFTDLFRCGGQGVSFSEKFFRGMKKAVTRGAIRPYSAGQ